jgi:HlyD family secretion protein
MKKEIFPKEILDNSFEVHQFKHSTRSKRIYSIILLLVLAILISLPFLYVDVYASARGIIVPKDKRISIFSLQSGMVVRTHIEANKFVQQGDTLLLVKDPAYAEKQHLLTSQLAEKRVLISDLEKLLSFRVKTMNSVQTKEYISAYALYRQGLNKLRVKHNQATQTHKRDSLLHAKGVISTVDFEQTALQYNISKSELNNWKQEHANNWEALRSELNRAVLELQSTQKQWVEASAQFVVVAPATGTLLEVQGVKPHGFVSAGQPLAQLSPQGELIVECFVAPTDIGYIYKNKEVKFQIDAYNYNQWGFATGRVLSIGDDIELIDNTPVFKLRCALNEPALFLKNGTGGSLKKGMTLTAQFVLTQRSLFQLLYDNVDDWLNPAKNHE